MKKRKVIAILSAAALTMLTACGTISSFAATVDGKVVTEEAAGKKEDAVQKKYEKSEGKPDNKTGQVSSNTSPAKELDVESLFTDRDLEQSPDLSEAEKIEVSDGKDVTIDSEGIYVISGESKESRIIVDAGDEDKVQLVLDSVDITNKSTPCIYVKNADKVFVTTTDEESSLSVTGTFEADGDTNTDAVIFSADDLVLNGTGTLKVSSTDNAVTSKDSLKITGGTIKIDCKGNAFEAHDAILASGGVTEVTACNDGLHAKDKDDDTKGYIYISKGTFNITATDDAVHATTFVRIDDGELTLSSAEGIESTIVLINNGTIDIEASDDGINAAYKSSSLSPLFEINDGKVTIRMGKGDTDGIDSNGDITVNGGTLDITGQSTFDYDGTGTVNGGTIIENGEETNTLTNQTFGGRGGMLGMGERPDMGEMPDMGERPDFSEMPGGGEMPDNGEMPDKNKMPGNGGRSGKNGRPGMGNRPDFGEKPDMGERPDFSETPDKSE